MSGGRVLLAGEGEAGQTGHGTLLIPTHSCSRERERERSEAKIIQFKRERASESSNAQASVVAGVVATSRRRRTGNIVVVPALLATLQPVRSHGRAGQSTNTHRAEHRHTERENGGTVNGRPAKERIPFSPRGGEREREHSTHTTAPPCQDEKEKERGENLSLLLFFFSCASLPIATLR